MVNGMIGKSAFYGLALALLLACAAPVPALSKNTKTPPPFRFGVLFIESNIQDAQYKTLIKDVVEVINRLYGTNIRIEWYTDEKRFAADVIKKKKFDLVYFKQSPLLNEVLSSGDHYIPLVALTTYRMKKQPLCIYVQKSSEARTVKDLKGKKANLYNSEFEYFILREMLGAPPETFFTNINTAPNGVSLVYSLAMQDAEAIFIYSANINLLEATNPGPLKKIRKLDCIPPEMEIPNVPILYSKNAPKETVEIMRKFYAEGLKLKEMERFRPLTRQFGIKFVPVKRSEYEPLLKIYEKARKNGWDKNFESWIKTVPEAKKFD